MVTAKSNGRRNNGHQTNGTGGHIPRGASGIGVHDVVPVLGYREYWYPAVEDRRIRSKPVALILLGEQIAFSGTPVTKSPPWPTPAPTGELSCPAESAGG